MHRLVRLEEAVVISAREPQEVTRLRLAVLGSLDVIEGLLEVKDPLFSCQLLKSYDRVQVERVSG